MAQRTFLQLAQRLALDCQETRTGLTTVANQVGRLARVVNAISSAWEDIQNAHKDYRFLRRSTSWVTVNGQATYTPAQCGVPVGTMGQWIRNTFRVYNTAAGTGSEVFLTYVGYDEWRDRYQYSAFRTSYGWPTEVTITPDDGIGLGMVPTGDYTIVGDYYRNAQILTVDGDIPILPEKHDSMIIVYRAMELYGPYLGAPELVNLGQKEFLPRFDRLRADQLPEPEFA